MRRKPKWQLIQQSKVAEPVSTFSTEEEVRLIGLADVALHNEPTKASPVAGDHAREEHQSLKRALEDAVERIKKGKDVA
jgi:hypothetical protein